MSEFCEKCGAQLDDAAKDCDNCVTSAETGSTANIAASDTGCVNSDKSTKTGKKVKLLAVLAAVVIAAIIAIVIISGSAGYKGTVNKAVNAYMDCDMDALVATSSNLYFCPDGEVFTDRYFGHCINDALNTLASHNIDKSRLSYEITENYEMSEDDYETLLNTLSVYKTFDTGIISKARTVRVNIFSKDDGSAIKKISFTLTKENGSWKVLYMFPRIEPPARFK